MPLPGNNQRLPKDDITVFLPVQAGETRLTPFLHICTAGNRMPGSIAKERFPADRQAIRGSVLVFSRILLILVRFCSYPIFFLFLSSTYRTNATTRLYTAQVSTLIGTATKSRRLKSIFLSSSFPQEPRIRLPPEEKGLMALLCAPRIVQANSVAGFSPVETASAGISPW